MKGVNTWMKGKHLSEETIKKKKEQIPWNKGKVNIYSEESKKKVEKGLQEQHYRNPAFLHDRAGHNPVFEPEAF